MIVFDIDGTILDMRYMVRWVLLAYDRGHGTSYFHGLNVEDIQVHENQLDRFLEEWSFPQPWYLINDGIGTFWPRTSSPPQGYHN